nr:MAG TPA: HNH endonuclease [Bacteriophage sp.]
MARSVELQRFYARKAWRDLRNRLIVERHAVCARCGRSFAPATERVIAHHIVELTDETLNDPMIALNQDNVELLCWACHNHTHGYSFGNRQVFIVWGPPLAGKSTYVAEQAAPGDLIVDMDSLWTAISTLPKYGRHEAIRQNVFGLRDALLNQIHVRLGAWNTAWVIGGYPRKGEREALAARLGANLIEIESSREECIQRADERFAGDLVAAAEWKTFIDRWFDDVQR